MDTMKICDTCHEEKIDSIEYFVKSKGIKPDGTPTTRSKCKKCTDKEAWEKKKSKKEGSTVTTKIKKSPDKQIEAPAPIMENQLEFTSPMEKIQAIRSNKSGVTALTDDEILSIRAMINNQLADSVHGDRSKRVPRTFNMDVAVVDWLKRKARESDTSTSDIINSVLHKLMNDS